MAKKTVKTVVTTDRTRTGAGKGKKTIAATTSKRSMSTKSQGDELLFSTENYKWMAIGVGLILLGMVLMLGGSMPDPNTWDPDIIYSTRITVLAPICILAGLGVEIYAIFKR